MPIDKTKFVEKRARKERRVKDDGPLGKVERRIQPERRHPLVEFVEFDEHIDIGKTSESNFHE